jgi:hypothetical protein
MDCPKAELQQAQAVAELIILPDRMSGGEAVPMSGDSMKMIFKKALGASLCMTLLSADSRVQID